MEQRVFNNKIDKLISDIERQMVYDHKALSDEIYNNIYNQLDFNFQEFDDVEFAFKANGNVLLNITGNILFENQVIQRIEFLV